MSQFCLAYLEIFSFQLADSRCDAGFRCLKKIYVFQVFFFVRVFFLGLHIF